MENLYNVPPPPKKKLIDNWQFIIKNRSPPLISNLEFIIKNYALCIMHYMVGGTQ